MLTTTDALGRMHHGGASSETTTFLRFQKLPLTRSSGVHATAKTIREALNLQRCSFLTGSYGENPLYQPQCNVRYCRRMPTLSSQDDSGELSAGSRPAEYRERSSQSRSRIARMDHLAYERRRKLLELWPVVMLALLAAASVALICWAIS